MFNILADVSLPNKPIVPTTPEATNYTAVNIAIAAMFITILLIIIFTLLALNKRKKDANKKGNDKKSN
jgi:competence protein ComGC